MLLCRPNPDRMAVTITLRIALENGGAWHHGLFMDRSMLGYGARWAFNSDKLKLLSNVYQYWRKMRFKKAVRVARILSQKLGLVPCIRRGEFDKAWLDDLFS